MRSWTASWVLAAGLTLVLLADAQSQGPVAAIAFRNDTKMPVIIQGFSSVGGMVRRGQPVVVGPGRIGGDFNVPPGSRLYTVYDANQPSRVLAKDVPFMIPPGASLLVSVRAGPGNLVALVPEAAH